MKRLLIMTMTLFIAAAAAGCSDEERDPEGEAMVWSAETPMPVSLNPGYASVPVPAQGYAYTFDCTNYRHPAISTASPAYDACTAATVRQNGFYLGRLSGRTFAIEFAPNDTGAERKAEVRMTAGGIFYTFYFTQAE
ncbi:MAG: hypothetical protein K2J51_05330 [Alistipes sp.]|nr:hypothetical protein [Alistipes sp.]